MSKFDSKDLLSIKRAAREYDIPAISLEFAIKRGAIRAIDIDDTLKLKRSDVEQFVKRTIKRGAGNQVVSQLFRNQSSQ